MVIQKIGVAITCVLTLSVVTGCAANQNVPAAIQTLATGENRTTTDANGQAVDASTAQTGGSNDFQSTLKLLDANFHMVTTSSGYAWGYRNNQFSIYHTNDGGQTWQPLEIGGLPIPSDNLSANGPGAKDYVTVSAIDNSHIWLTWVSQDNLHVAFSKDEGASWQTSVTSVGSAVQQIQQVFYSNVNDGWIFATGDSSTGQASKFLYCTTDSGASFKLYNASSNQLPHNGVTAQMSFAPDGKHGAFVSVDDEGPSIQILRTNDRGKHFAETAIPLPANVQTATDIYISTPQCTNTGDVQVSVDVQEQNGDELIVFSQNAHGAWTSHSTQIGAVKALSWTNLNQAVVVEEVNGKLDILHTLDGGQSWYSDGSIPASMLPSNLFIKQLQMTNLATGYMLLESGDLQPSLFKTSDGGHHWLKK